MAPELRYLSVKRILVLGPDYMVLADCCSLGSPPPPSRASRKSDAGVNGVSKVASSLQELSSILGWAASSTSRALRTHYKCISTAIKAGQYERRKLFSSPVYPLRLVHHSQISLVPTAPQWQSYLSNDS
eukprot:6520654-Prorocentrum_lima.AAC.1